MTYLITNLFRNINSFSIELRNSKLEKIFLKSELEDFNYNVGDYVEVEKKQNKYYISSIIDKPCDFLKYYKKSKYSEKEIYEAMFEYYEKIKNEDYKLIIEKTIFENPSFFHYPAAKNIHHAYIGGLSEHTLNILKLSNSFIEQYNLDQDLLFTAIMLHDFSKIYELEHYGLNYTIEGNLIGHIVQVIDEITKVCIENNIDIKKSNIIILKHLILSHHGKLEYGSPKEPMIREAFILSQLDETDAKMNTLETALNDIEEGKMSGPLMAFDKKRFLNFKGV